MTTVISVKFRGGSRLYYFSPGELEINAGDGVIVETARGTEYGDVMVGIHDVPDDQVIQPLKEVIRVATDRDREMRDSYRAKEKDAFATCMERIQAHGLDMKLVDVEYTFNGSKIVFYFTADGRVDFRASGTRPRCWAAWAAAAGPSAASSSCPTSSPYP